MSSIAGIEDDNIAAKIIVGISAFIGMVGLLVGVAFVGSIYSGFVMQTLWNWFGEPLVHVHLYLWHTIGLVCLIAVIKGARYRPTPKGEDSHTAQTLIFGFLYPTILLATGALAHHFM